MSQPGTSQVPTSNGNPSLKNLAPYLSWESLGIIIFPSPLAKLNPADDLSKHPDLLGNALEKLCNTSSKVLTL